MNPKLLRKTASFLVAAAVSCCAVPFDPLVQTADRTLHPAAAEITADDGGTPLKWGDVNADGKIDDADAAAAPDAAIADCPQADVNADGVIDGTDVDMIASFVSGEISYFPVGADYNDAPAFVTRGEWIHALVDGFAVSVEDESSITPCFTDLDGYEYQKDIELAANFGIFDVMEAEFHPDEFVTRDFAAHTMCFCIGYADPVTVIFTDTDAVYYDADAQVALNQGWFRMVDQAFCPSMYVTAAEAALAYDDMQKAYEAMQIDADYEDTVQVEDFVIDMTEFPVKSYSADQVVFAETSKSLHENDTISFNLGDLTVVRNVTAVSLDEDTGEVTVGIADAADESVEACDAQGYAYIDWDHMEVMDDSMQVEVRDDAEKPAASLPNPHLMVNKGGTFDLKNVTLYLNGNIPIGDHNISVGGTISKIKIPYNVKTKGLSLQEFYLGFESEAALNVEYSYEVKSEAGSSRTLLSVPVVGAGIVGINIVLKASVSLSGEISIGWTYDMSGGIRYVKGQGWTHPHDLQKKAFTMSAAAKVKFGLQVGIEAKIGSIATATGYVAAGINCSITTSVSTQNAAVRCTNLKAYLYAELGFQVKVLTIKYGGSWEFINEDNSPISYNLHIENGKVVPACTVGENYSNSSNATHKGGSLSGKSSGGYVKGSGYASGYTKGAKGKTVQQVYYKSTIAFKELEPPHVISENMVLTEDTVIHGDLEILGKSTLDLNGHKLTVEGNVRMYSNNSNNAVLYVNGGSAIINGDLILSDSHGKLIMNNKNDYVLVKGNYHKESNYNGTNELTAGTLELQGDISGDSLNSSDMHKVILSGTKDINVNVSSSERMFNMLEIKNSDQRKINVDKKFYVSSSTVCDGKTLNFICNETGSNQSDLKLGKLTVDQLHIQGDLTLHSIDFQGKEIQIDGNVYCSSNPGGTTVTLNKTTVNVNGNITCECNLNMNGSTINVTGDFRKTNCDMNMTNKNDRLNIGGNFEMSGGESNITDGVIDVKGDITLGYYDSFSGYNKMILSGDQDITVYMPKDPYYYYLNDVEIRNSDKRKIYVEGGFYAKGKTDCGDQPLQIDSRDGSIGFGELICSELQVSGDAEIGSATKLKAKKAVFDGNLGITGETADFNGVPTDIAKKFTIADDTDLRGAEVNCGDCELTGDSYGCIFSINGGKLNVAGDMTVSGGSIKMEGENDLIDIQGDLDVPRYNSNDSITAGTIRLKGDVVSPNAALMMRDASRFVFAGETDQLIRIGLFWKKDSGVKNYSFANLEVEHAASKNLILQGTLDFGNLYADADTVNITSKDGKLISGKLWTDLNITGDVTKTGSYADYVLNGHTLSIVGNLYHEDGMIELNTGRMNVSGDYMIVTDHDSAVVGKSGGLLKMINDSDYLFVGGSFVTKSSADHSNSLTAGTMEIKGNFSQLSGGSTKAFPASGTHTVILSGETKQNVIFENYADSHFNILKLTQDPEQYVFSDDPCWNELGSDDPPSGTTSGDVNEDGSVDLKDVLMMRRALAGGWELAINEQNADVNKDGSFDLKDVTILRRYLAGGWDVTLV